MGLTGDWAMATRELWTNNERAEALEMLLDSVEEAFRIGDVQIDRYSVCDIMSKLSAMVMVSALTSIDPLPPAILRAGVESCVEKVRTEMKELTLIIDQTMESDLMVLQCSPTVH